MYATRRLFQAALLRDYLQLKNCSLTVIIESKDNHYWKRTLQVPTNRTAFALSLYYGIDIKVHLTMRAGRRMTPKNSNFLSRNSAEQRVQTEKSVALRFLIAKHTYR
jgi:hypothetical protein